MFRQQSYQLPLQWFLNHNWCHPPMPEFTDVPLRHPSIAKIPHHFCNFAWCITVFSFGRTVVPWYFPGIVSSNEKRQWYKWRQCIDDSLLSLHFGAQLPQYPNLDSRNSRSWTGSELLLDKPRAFLFNERADPINRASLQTCPTTQSCFSRLIFGRSTSFRPQQCPDGMARTSGRLTKINWFNRSISTPDCTVKFVTSPATLQAFELYLTFCTYRRFVLDCFDYQFCIDFYHEFYLVAPPMEKTFLSSTKVLQEFEWTNLARHGQRLNSRSSHWWRLCFHSAQFGRSQRKKPLASETFNTRPTISNHILPAIPHKSLPVFIQTSQLLSMPSLQHHN